MNFDAAIRDWMFKGLSVEHTINELESSGFSVRSPTDPQALQRVIPLEDFSTDIRGSAMRALPAYLAFFCLENSAREVISERLLETHGVDWWGNCASRPVREKVSKRQDSEGKNRWHTRRGASEIFYTDFGDLLSLVKNNWESFEDLFPDVSWIESRFAELEASRNIVAHNNILEPRELDRIKMYLADWIRQVG